jgi:hypothetical protein
MKRFGILIGLAACTDAATPTVDGVLFRDPTCGSPASEDCIVLVPRDEVVALPSEPFELFVHSDGALADVSLAPGNVHAQTREVNAGGTDFTLFVDPLPYGPVTCGDFGFTAIDPARTPLYPSGYSSNCTCSFCTLYCVVNGTTQKGGTCC